MKPRFSFASVAAPLAVATALCATLSDAPFEHQCVAQDKPRQEQTARPSPAVAVYDDLTYAEVDGQTLQLDLRVPQNVKRPPLVVYIHGGSWRAGSRKKPPVAKLVEEGFAVASISYRFSTVATFPAQIHDCKGAIRKLRAWADRYGYDAERIGVAGSSAGGHLAVLLGTSGDVEELEGTVGGATDQSSRVQAVVDFYGPTDFPLRSRTQPSRAEEVGSSSYGLFGGPVSKNLPLATLAGGVTHASADDPPLLILHGDKDTTVLMDQSESLVAAYKKAGLEPTLIVVPGGKHGGPEYTSGENFRRVVEFFEKHLRAAK
jgi:acetyl esterase/lipase